MYHYASNNPVRYIDPDGRIQHDALEIRFVREVLGERGLEIYNNTSFVWIPNICGLRSASWDISDGVIFLTSDIYSRPMASDDGRETFIHELYHQIQYADAPKGIKLFAKNPYKVPLPNNLSFKISGAFPDLISEYKINNEMSEVGIDNYTYQYDAFDLSKYKTLNDLVHKEAQAQFMGVFGKYYYRERYAGGVDYPWHRTQMIQMAEILKNSGFDTEAVNWVLENQ